MKSLNPERQQRAVLEVVHSDSAAKGAHELMQHGPEGQPSDTSLSPIGILCECILSEINNLIDLASENKVAIGQQIESILLIFREYEMRSEVTERKLTKLRTDLKHAREDLRVLRQEHFGQSSEREKSEIEDEFLFRDEISDEEVKGEADPPPGRRRLKIPKNIQPLVVDNYPEDRKCSTCGDTMPSISSWKSTTLRIIPEHVEVIDNVYHTCACNREACKEHKPKSAKTGRYIMKGRKLEIDFVVEAAIQKFHEHIPPFRMERRLINSNFNISRQAIGKNIIHLSGYLEPVRQALLKHVKSGPAAHMDETPVRIQAPGSGKCRIGYFWAICRDERNWNTEATPAVAFQFAPSRAGAVACELLSGASLEYLQTDGYAGYRKVFSHPDDEVGLASVRCWAHVRRKFLETWKATKSSFAKRIVSEIRKLYSIERAAKCLSPELRVALRQKNSAPVVDEIFVVLNTNQDAANGKLKSAIEYTLKAANGLRLFTIDGRLEMDNNPVERCIRGIALTKKNSLFVGNDCAGDVWATYFSIIESARLNRIDPRAYLSWVAAEIERSRGEVDPEALLPWLCPNGRLED